MSSAKPRFVVINVVGLTSRQIGEATPHLSALAADGFQAELGTVLPAVTCPVQSTLLTGVLPRDHGVVANGWYERESAEVRFWRQSNRLVAAPKLWERARARRPGFRCAQLFWWFNLYADVEWSVTPRPHYPADGRKILDVHSTPAALRERLVRELGGFPFVHFWGPGSDLRSSQWIGRAAESVLVAERPDLTLVYLPHLDYDFQRFGPDFPGAQSAVRAVDEVAGGVIQAAREMGAEVVVLSEYGIHNVSGSISLQRVLRREGLLEVRDSVVGELLEPGACRAFAVTDHQVAHVYVARPEDVAAVKRLLEGVPGVDQVLDAEGKRACGLDHPRSGELVAVAAADRWFDYYYWLDDHKAPDFARTVDIHRKPGYDPAELFLAPGRATRWRILWRLLERKLGLRCLLDVIPLDAGLVKGSHGRLPERAEDGPVFLSSSKRGATSRLEATEVADWLLEGLLA